MMPHTWVMKTPLLRACTANLCRAYVRIFEWLSVVRSSHGGIHKFNAQDSHESFNQKTLIKVRRPP